MWVRRSEHGITDISRRNRRRRLNPLGPLLVTLFVMLLLFLFDQDLCSSSFFSSPALALSFLIIFVLLYFARAALGRYELLGAVRLSPPTDVQRTMICPHCHKIQFDTESHSCACGGRLEDLEHWRWIEDKHPPPNVANT